VRQAADFYRERLTEIAKLKFDNTIAIREAQKEIRKINANVNALLAGTKIPQTELLIFVDASSIVSGKLDVEYFTNAAGWKPLYDFRFDAVNKPLELVYNANVYQSTGEDWNEVELSLTEGLPKQKAALPEFDRWYINRRTTSSVKAVRSQDYQMGIGTLKGTLLDSQTGEPLPFVNIVLQRGGQQINGSSTDFDGNYTIRPIDSGVCDVVVSYVGYNGEDRLLTIKTEKVPVEFLYRAIPKVDTDVYLLARITDWGNLQLLSGKSTIYFQGAYSGESNIDAESVKDTLEIALGRDENILLERRLNKELSTEQTFGSKVKKELHWEIAVRSNKSHPIMLELIDQLPLSNDRNIIVEALDIGEAKNEKETGKLTWELILEPNSSKQVNFSYELKYPESALVHN
jgi:hypothetical protein